MKKLLAVLLILGPLCLTSCDPAYSLMVYNRSTADRTIRIVYADGYGEGYKADKGNYGGYYKNFIILSRLDSTRSDLLRKDSLSAHWTTSYSFVLPAASKVLLESGLGTVPPAQQIIIDGKDTIDTELHDSRLKKRYGLLLGGPYEVTLSN